MNTRLPIEQLREAYLRAILAGELAMAERIIREAIDVGFTEDAIDTGIIAPARPKTRSQKDCCQVTTPPTTSAASTANRYNNAMRRRFRRRRPSVSAEEKK